jgi:hypothetical protein
LFKRRWLVHIAHVVFPARRYQALSRPFND